MANEEQNEFWNGQAGEKWVEEQETLDRLLAPLSAAALARAAVQPGERVLDIGCGCGATAIAMAEAGAQVTGMDISAPMLAHARSRAEKLTNATFKLADAATAALTPEHQLVFSRFGVMFFDDPTAAFRNLRTGLADDGRLSFVCWRAVPENPWIYLASKAVQPFLADATGESGAPPDPRAPGPFAFADEDYLRGILTDAGFKGVQLERFETKLTIGGNLDEAMAMQAGIGPVAQVFAVLDDSARQAALAAAREALTPYATDDGVSLGSSVWLVQATAN